jgi:RimJ/RimL family protein N-acetyltransferase
MIVAIQRLNETAGGALLRHYLQLPPADRRLRFGASLSPEAVAEFVRGIDFIRHGVFAVHDRDLAITGVAHIGVNDDAAELGLSVLPTHRGAGAGSALVERAILYARNRFLSRLYMHCLAENAPIMRIARRFGMHIATASGNAESFLELPPPSPASIAAEVVTEQFALLDCLLKLQFVAWRCLAAEAAEPALSKCSHTAH